MAIPLEKKIKGLRVLFMHLSPERLKLLDDHVAIEGDDVEFYGPTFNEPVSLFAHSRSRSLVVLVIRDGKVIRASVGHRSFSAGTGLSQVRMGETEIISELDLTKPMSAIAPRLQKHAWAAFESLGLLSEKASEALLLALSKLDARILRIVEEASQVRHNPLEDLPEKDQLRIQQERDAALTAMFLVGVDRAKFMKSETQTFEKNKWFMDEVASARLREDTALYNDATNFPEFEKIGEHVAGVVRMRHFNVLLSIFLINRQPLEEVTGSDLIYYNESFGSFVFVQYKAMESGAECDAFRLPNEDLEKEIEKMREIERKLVTPTDFKEPKEFRLSAKAFFLKFCPRIVQQPSEPDLVPGMYFPLDHWGLLSGSHHLAGIKGGRLLRFQKKHPFTNADRYLNNSDFAVLVRNGWVGTSVNQSAVLETLIKKTLESGRSVTFAMAGPVPPTAEETDILL